MSASRDMTGGKYWNIDNFQNPNAGPQTWVGWFFSAGTGDRGFFGMDGFTVFLKNYSSESDMRGKVGGSWVTSLGEPDQEWSQLSIGWASGGSGDARVTRDLNSDITTQTPPDNSNDYFTVDAINDVGLQAGSHGIGTIAMYTKYLTMNEIAEIRYNPFSIVDSLKCLIPSWQKDVGTVKDLSGNGNDATESSNSTDSSLGPPVFLLGGQ